MGKSSKKTKSDRINALRKQYDSFMEEDKKRKYRNDFILDSLEKMRLCNAMVPVQNSANAYLKNHCVLQEQPKVRQKRTLFDRSPLLVSKQKTDVLMNFEKIDEELILKEINKKYILIPKLQSTRDNMSIYYNSPSINDDTDWKKKYNILDDLKKIEKEELPQIKADICDNFSPNNDKNLRSGSQELINSTIYHPQNKQTVPSSAMNKGNNKNVSENKYSYHKDTKLPIDNIKNLIPCKNDIENDSVSIIPHVSSDLNFINPKINEQGNCCSININGDGGKEYKNSNKLNHSDIEIDNQIDITKIAPTDIVEKNKDLLSGNVVTKGVPKNETFESSISQLNINNFAALSSKDEKEEEKKNEIVTQPEHMNQSSELIPSDAGEPFSDNIKQQEDEHNFDNNENAIISDNVISSQIDDFEAEQKEMFYSEESEYKNNTEELEYNEQNEQYPNEQYSYYDESQQEQPCYAEINEHEESTERYDPNYEQQYVSNYEDNIRYDNQQEVTNVSYNEHVNNLEYVQNENTVHINTENMNESVANENVSYDVEQFDNKELPDNENIITAQDEQNMYQIQAEYTEMEYGDETIHNLEQQLDREEGYIEIENTVSHISGSEIENLPDVTPEIQKADITLVPE